MLRPSTSLLLYRDGRNLNPGIVDQSGCLNSLSRRLWVRHDGLMNLVHFCKIVNVGQVYSDGLRLSVRILPLSSGIGADFSALQPLL
jgi:hypothetical protein